jgi:hypothetical protein
MVEQFRLEHFVSEIYLLGIALIALMMGLFKSSDKKILMVVQLCIICLMIFISFEIIIFKKSAVLIHIQLNISRLLLLLQMILNLIKSVNTLFLKVFE